MTTDLNPEGLEKAAEAIDPSGWRLRRSSALPVGHEGRDAVVRRSLEQARAAVSAYLEAQTVTTMEELDALPWWSLVQGHDGFKHLRHPDGWMLAVFGSTKPHLAREIELPAAVLHRPAP